MSKYKIAKIVDMDYMVGCGNKYIKELGKLYKEGDIVIVSEFTKGNYYKIHNSQNLEVIIILKINGWKKDRFEIINIEDYMKDKRVLYLLDKILVEEIWGVRMKGKKKIGKEYTYTGFYGICFHHGFWNLFQIWDKLAIDEYHILKNYHLI